MTTMTDLLLPRGSTKNKEQVQKLLESQPAVKKDRAGELAWTRSCLPAGVQGRLKNRVGGRGGGGGSGPRTWKLQKRNFTSTRVIFLHFVCIFFAIFFAFVFCIFCCISQTGSHFLGMFFAFPKPGSHFFAFFFLRFLDRVCHPHRLPDPDEKTTRTCRVFGLSSSAPDQATRAGWENDKKMTNKWHQMTTKWQKNDQKMTNKWHRKTGMTKNDKTKRQKITKINTVFNNPQSLLVRFS